MEIISATIKNLSAIRDIALATWPKAYSNILSAEQIEYMLEMMYSETALKTQMQSLNHKFLLAKEKKEWLGFASYELDYQNTQTTKIHKLYVLPEFQKKHLGKAFIETISRIALENKNRLLSLNMNKHNSAIHFYKNQGFEIVRSEQIDIGNGFIMDDFVFEKIIG